MLLPLAKTWTVRLLLWLTGRALHATGSGDHRPREITSTDGRATAGGAYRRCSEIIKMCSAAVIVAPSIATGAYFHGSNLSDKIRWKIFRDPNLNIEFSFPKNRKIVVGCHGSNNCIALIGRPKKSGDYILAFEVFEGGLDTVAVERAVFQKEDNHWVANGHDGKYPVEHLSGTGWQGLKSAVDCGISYRGGFHASAGQCLWVVASNGTRSVVVDSQGTAPIDQDMMRAILSLRFI